jgi:hypothetical protein
MWMTYAADLVQQVPTAGITASTGLQINLSHEQESDPVMIMNVLATGIQPVSEHGWDCLEAEY